MKELELFKTYNGITRKYIVMAVTVQDLLNDPRYKDNKSLLLLARPNIAQPKPHKKKKQKSTRELIADLQTESKSTRELISSMESHIKTFREILLNIQQDVKELQQ